MIAALVAAPGVAAAYHNGSVYDRAPGAGGGGGLFYTASPRERGWDCTACHEDPPGDLALDITGIPATYDPGAVYPITIAMADPGGQLGLPATRSNFNAIAVTILDADGAVAGVIGGFAPGEFYQRGEAILASDSTMVNETAWAFTWTAPAANAGPISIYLGVVDGDGAGSTGTETLTDPLGDDTAMASFTVREAGAARAAPRPSRWPIALVVLVWPLWIVRKHERRGP